MRMFYCMRAAPHIISACDGVYLFDSVAGAMDCEMEKIMCAFAT